MPITLTAPQLPASFERRASTGLPASHETPASEQLVASPGLREIIGSENRQQTFKLTMLDESKHVSAELLSKLCSPKLRSTMLERAQRGEPTFYYSAPTALRDIYSIFFRGYKLLKKRFLSAKRFFERCLQLGLRRMVETRVKSWFADHPGVIDQSQVWFFGVINGRLRKLKEPKSRVVYDDSSKNKSNRSSSWNACVENRFVRQTLYRVHAAIRRRVFAVF